MARIVFMRMLQANAYIYFDHGALVTQCGIHGKHLLPTDESNTGLTCHTC